MTFRANLLPCAVKAGGGNLPPATGSLSIIVRLDGAPVINLKCGAVLNQHRKLAGYQLLQRLAGGSDDRFTLDRAGIASTQSLPAFFPIRRPRSAGIAGALSALTFCVRAPSRLVNLFGAFEALRHLIPSLRVKPSEQSSCGFSKCFRSFSTVLPHAHKHEAGAAQDVGQITQELGRFTHERH